jgi:hypothetical protein
MVKNGAAAQPCGVIGRRAKSKQKYFAPERRVALG